MQQPKPKELEINPLLSAVSTEISKKIELSFPDDINSARFYNSLLTGGVTMANATVTFCEGVKKVWGEGSEIKAAALAKLFSMFMLSQTFVWVDEWKKDKDKAASINLPAVSNLLGFFGDNSEEAINDFMNLDTQLKHEVSHETDMTHMRVLLMAMACEACGHICIDWSKVKFPVKSLESLTHSGAMIDSMAINSINDVRALNGCHSMGLQAMIKCHEDQAA